MEAVLPNKNENKMKESVYIYYAEEICVLNCLAGAKPIDLFSKSKIV